MTVNATTNLGLALPDQGEWDGTWGTNLNQQITELIDSAVAGTTTLSADADVTLTDTDFVANESRQAIILWTASNGATTRNVTAPARSKVYVVVNAGTGSIVLRGAGPTTGITIVAGEKCVAAWNGSDFVKATAQVAGSNTQVLFNNNGLVGASSDFTWDGMSLTVGSATAPSWGFNALNVAAISSGAANFWAGANYYWNSGDKYVTSSSGATKYVSGGQEHIFYSANAGAPGSSITWTQVLKTDVNNNVKIGTGEPSYRLDVDGTFGVSGAASFANQASTGIAYFNGAELTSSANLTYSSSTLLFSASAAAPVSKVSSSGSSVAYQPYLVLERTTTASTGTNGLAGTIRWSQTQTDGSVAVPAAIAVTSSNSPATTNGTLYLQAESAVYLSNTSSGNYFSANSSKATVYGDTLSLRTTKTPASSSDTGTAGDICWDSDYVYVCVATNTWKRTALATW